jgi:hypothetical protein
MQKLEERIHAHPPIFRTLVATVLFKKIKEEKTTASSDTETNEKEILAGFRGIPSRALPRSRKLQFQGILNSLSRIEKVVTFVIDRTKISPVAVNIQQQAAACTG